MIGGNRREANQALRYLTTDGVVGDPDDPPTVEFRTVDGRHIDATQTWAERCVVVIPNWHESQAVTASAKRMRKHRARKKEEQALAANSDASRDGNSDASRDGPEEKREEETRKEESRAEPAAPGSPEWVRLELSSRSPLASLATLEFAEHLLGVAASAGTVDLLGKALDEAADKLGAKDAAGAPLAKEHRATFIVGCAKHVRAGKPHGEAQHEQTRAEVTAAARRDRQRARSDQAAHDKAAAGAVSTQDAAALARKVASALSMPGKGDK
jgi:hypothetical protein